MSNKDGLGNLKESLGETRDKLARPHRALGAEDMVQQLRDGPRFNAQYLHGSSQLSINSIVGDPMPPLFSSAPGTHMVQRHTCRQTPSHTQLKSN